MNIIATITLMALVVLAYFIGKEAGIAEGYRHIEDDLDEILRKDKLENNND